MGHKGYPTEEGLRRPVESEALERCAMPCGCRSPTIPLGAVAWSSARQLYACLYKIDKARVPLFFGDVELALVRCRDLCKFCRPVSLTAR